jgi:phosphohistidine phosphatase
MKLPYEIIRIEDLIYMGYTDDILRMVQKQDDALSDILIFGHNPAFTALANQLMKGHIDNIPTAGIVSLSFDTDTWSKIGSTKASADIFDYPKRYV